MILRKEISNGLGKSRLDLLVRAHLKPVLIEASGPRGDGKHSPEPDQHL